MKDAITQADEHGYVTRCSAAAARSRRCGRATGASASSASGSPPTRVIQGTAADIIKIAMVRCHDSLEAAGLKTRCILQIHDELLFEGPPEEMEQATAIVTREMVGAIEHGPAARRRRRRRRQLAESEVGENAAP